MNSAPPPEDTGRCLGTSVVLQTGGAPGMQWVGGGRRARMSAAQHPTAPRTAHTDRPSPGAPSAEAETRSPRRRLYRTEHGRAEGRKWGGGGPVQGTALRETDPTGQRTRGTGKDVGRRCRNSERGFVASPFYRWDTGGRPCGEQERGLEWGGFPVETWRHQVCAV